MTNGRRGGTWGAAIVAALVLAGCGGGGGSAATADPIGTGGAAVTAPATPAAPAAPAGASTQPVPVQLAELTRGLERPWGLAFLPDGSLLVTERVGGLKRLSASGQLQAQLSGLPSVDARGQGGLLGIALDPAFASNRRVYLSFSEADPAQPGANGTAVARAVLSSDGGRLENLAVIWRQQPKVASTAHFGSRLVFDREGALLVTLGDRLRSDQRDFAQDLTRGHGKIVRITTDGAAAPGNPAWNVAGALPETWSYGHRNVQGAALHPDTGELWVSEHGPQGGDEINRVLPGRNYGWPLASRGFEYDTTTPVGATSLPGMEDPLWVWERSDGSPWSGGTKSSSAPAGMTFYTASAVPQWRGNLFVASLAGQALWRLTLEGNRVVAHERMLFDQGERVRDVAQAPDGSLYLLTDSGKLLRYGA